jgi:urease alpha subunit
MHADQPDKIKSYGIKKRPEAVKNCRKITKKDMKLNDHMPKMTGGSICQGEECLRGADAG